MWDTEEKGSVQEQGSEAWHAYRAIHIGASEVPAIMGTCDFKTDFQIWLEKTGTFKKEFSSFATERGKYYEPIILTEYENKTGLKAHSKVLEFDIWPVLSASLDGLTESNVVVEIKCPSKAKHQMALIGIVPETYRDQIQTQLLVTGASLAHYVSYDPNEVAMRLAIVEVRPDFDRQVQIIEKCKIFWELVQSKAPPEGLSVQPGLQDDINELIQVKLEIKNLDVKKDLIEEKLKSMMKANQVQCNDFELKWSDRKGSIDYAAIPELKKVNLENYRKPSTQIFSVRQK